MASVSTTTSHTTPSKFGSRSFVQRWLDGDAIAHLITLVFAASILLITALLVVNLWRGSADARHKFGWHFFFTSTWDPVAGDFGALPFIYGTLVTSALALIMAVPLGLGAAIFLAELAPRRISDAGLFDRLARRGTQRDLWPARDIYRCPGHAALYRAVPQEHSGILAHVSGTFLRRGDADSRHCAGGYGCTFHHFRIA